MPEKPMENADPVYEVLRGRLVADPADAVGAAMQLQAAQTLAAYSSACKITEEIAEMRNPLTLKRKKLDYLMSWLHGSLTLLGIGGTILFAQQMLAEKGKVKEQLEKLKDKQMVIDQANDRAERATDKSQLAIKEADLKTQAAEFNVLKSNAKKEEAEAKAAAADAVLAQAEEKTKLLRAEVKTLEGQTTAVRENYDKLSTELAKLQEKKPVLANQVAQVLGKDSISAITLNPPPDLSAAELTRQTDDYRKEVENLFDPLASVRGATYSKLTTEKSRFDPPLLEALLEVGGKKVLELQRPDISDTEAVALRRGVDNVVVTIRDMSRSVTKTPPKNKQRLIEFAQSLIDSNLGVAKEAQSLKDWLTNGNDT